MIVGRVLLLRYFPLMYGAAVYGYALQQDHLRR